MVFTIRMSHKILQHFSIKLYESSIWYSNSKELVEKDQQELVEEQRMLIEQINKKMEKGKRKGLEESNQLEDGEKSKKIRST